MDTHPLLSEDDTAWLRSYQAKVVTTFTSRFQECGDRFAGWQPLINRFSAAVETVIRLGRGKFRAVDEAHNELCIAHAILSSRSPTFGRVEYEPTLSGTARSIDFRCAADPDLTIYVDVKTIKPEARDRWEQYERAVCKKLLPEHVRITLLKEGLGGELWHYMFAARSRMLDYAVGLERKIADAKLAGTGAVFILVFCGEGFYWHEDELEDFVNFYKLGSHRSDDPFSLMEIDDMKSKNIALDRTISRFGCMHRYQGDINAKRLTWNVQPPSLSEFH